jgi:hypothetical protein
MEARILFGWGVLKLVRRKYPVKNFYKIQHSDFKTRFFQQLASHALLQGFPKLEGPARNGPFATKRFAATAYEQRAAIFDDYAANTNHRTLGILAGESHFRK